MDPIWVWRPWFLTRCQLPNGSNRRPGRYIPGERRSHAVHFDGHAYVTAVLGISDPENYQAAEHDQTKGGTQENSNFYNYKAITIYIALICRFPHLPRDDH